MTRPSFLFIRIHLTPLLVSPHRRKPGVDISRIYLWSFYGEGGQQPPAGWEHYWPRLETWLKRE
jgi:hypothetical protein